MNVRLVAYRKADTASTLDTTYNLDFQEVPNINLNFKFSDIKEPETRKASYSQTFKLPFTDNNNEFFQNWYNVNLSTLVFSTKSKFNATLFVGTVPQFEGFLQLKAVYTKAQVYEVVLMSNTADLFSVIGEQKLRDAFLQSDGNYSTELNHTFNATQLEDSWNGTTNDFINSSGVSLRDTDVNVQKLMYPISVTQPNFYHEKWSNKFLDMGTTALANPSIFPNGIQDAFPYMVQITQFRPALQIKNILRLIIAKAGFSYSSNFIDGDFFGKIFMTTGTDLGDTVLPAENQDVITWDGNMRVGNNGVWGQFLTAQISSNCQNLAPVVVPGNQTAEDNQNLWNNAEDYFTKTNPTMSEVSIKHRCVYNDIVPCGGSNDSSYLDVYLEGYNTTTNTDTGVIYKSTTFNFGDSNDSDGEFTTTHVLDLSTIPLGVSARIKMRIRNIDPNGVSPFITLGAVDSFGPYNNWESKIVISGSDYTPTGVYGSVINVPMCIDANLTQKAFLKDLIERFNLIVLSDPNDAGNLIIEPYTDYLAQSTIKYWTDKLDTSKEVLVKDTVSIQKKNVNFSDLEDVDMVNKWFKDNQPEINVYGKLSSEVTSNDFANGELKNNPFFSPYINQRIYKNEYTEFASEAKNFVVQYEYTYKDVDGVNELSLENTKPKLFWYNGSATTVKRAGFTTDLDYWLHNQPVSGEVINAYNFTTYPVCTPYDITPVDNAYTLSPTNKSLYWNSNPPIVGENDIFNYLSYDGSWFANTLYGLYWQPYLNNIYSDNARIMECHLNLNEVDIFNFKFNDEIFIKNTYWRILSIDNYQVNNEGSTKVTLLKIVDSLNNCNDCDYVPGFVNGSNIANGVVYIWCPEGTPNCTPDVTAPNFEGIYVTKECCDCRGGGFQELGNNTGLGICYENSGSLPLVLKNTTALRSFLQSGSTKGVLSGLMGGLNNPLIRGVDNNKFSQSLLPHYGDDIIIKYNRKDRATPQMQGESHRLVLSGYTIDNTKAYAYPQGAYNSTPLTIPTDTNIIIRVKGITTVIGGSNTTYPIGTTEGFAYFTAFKSGVGGVTQLGTLGGTPEFSLKESGAGSVCALYIDIYEGVLRFGITDTATRTKRIWALTVDLDINRIQNFSLGFNENWALYQNGDNIQLQNGSLLIWN